MRHERTRLARGFARAPVYLADGYQTQHAPRVTASPDDLLLGTVGDVPFYIDAEQYRRWRTPHLVLDVGPGAADGFSLEGLTGVHFVSRER